MSFLVNSAAAYLDASVLQPQLNAERYNFFTNGEITRDGRSIKFDFGDTTLAELVGVSHTEAIAKTDWSVYKGTIDAAFNTPGVTSIGFPGYGDRPTASSTLTWTTAPPGMEWTGTR